MAIPILTIKLKKSAETVFLAMVYTQTIKPIVEKYETEILKNNVFVIGDIWKEHPRAKEKVGKRILNPKEMYLVDDDKATIYFKMLDEEIKKNNLTVKKEGNCPLLEAEEIERQAKRELLKNAEYLTKIKEENIYDLDKKEKLVDLILKVCSPFINTKKVLKTINS